MLASAGEIAELALAAGQMVVNEGFLGETLERLDEKNPRAVDRIAEAERQSPIDPVGDIFGLRLPEALGDRFHLFPFLLGAVDFHEEGESLDTKFDRLAKATGSRAWVCEKEPLPNAESFSPGRAFQIGKLTVETRLTSGHADGGVTFFIQGLAQPVAMVGDSMFAGSMGGGMVSYADALRNNREQVLTLPDATIICSGHGPLTTVGEQKHANPFFAA